ncbi:YecA family protein [Salipaludibacillus sp. HK11]|uniref:YecA family protein n=1 Tax=Salipaludibacillus sp. HK11 TaxID=3394320 RepID=UPI0039FC4CC1
MLKSQRNDPCPCGSGNKYKKCCGKNNVVTFPTHIIENELKVIQNEIFDFTMQNYEKDIEDLFHESFHTLSDIEKLNSSLAFLSTIWAVFHEPFGQNGKTIFDDYLNRNIAKIKRTQTRHIVREWKGLKPSVFRVIKDHSDDLLVEMKNIVTEEIVFVTLNAEEIFMKDQFIIAYSYKINSQKHDVFISHLSIPAALSIETEVNIEKSLAVMNELIDKPINLEKYIEEYFTEFLLDVLVLPALADDFTDLPKIEGLNWHDPRHELVAIHLANHMQDEYQKEVITIAQMLWFVYCKKVDPQPNKLGLYAGAIEYLINEFNIGKINYYTQKALAKKYAVNSSTLSIRIREIREVLSDEMERFDQIGIDEFKEDIKF